MKRLIIVEGFDNSGKTTACIRLSSALGVDVVHSPGHKVSMRDYLEQLIMQVKDGKELIHDRISLVCEEVYGVVLRGGSDFSKDWATWFNKLLEVNPIIIYCRPPTQSVFGNIGEREQMEGVVSKGPQLLRRYDQVMQLLFDTYSDKLSMYTYNYTEDHDASKLVAWVKEAKGDN